MFQKCIKNPVISKTDPLVTHYLLNMSDQTNAAIVCIDTSDHIIFLFHYFHFYLIKYLILHFIVFGILSSGYLLHNFIPPNTHPTLSPNMLCFVQLGHTFTSDISYVE